MWGGVWYALTYWFGITDGEVKQRMGQIRQNVPKDGHIKLWLAALKKRRHDILHSAKRWKANPTAWPENRVCINGHCVDTSLG